MPIQRASLRIAVATITTGLLAVGPAGPVFAAKENRHAGSVTAAQHRHDGSGQSARASARASGRSEKPRAGSAASAPARRGRTSQPQNEGSHGRANPPRHTPVTVCHRLGNGSFHLLTMDDSALKAHVGHGDIYPVPDSGCPAPATGTSSPGGDGEEGDGATTLPGSDVAPDETIDHRADVLDRLDLTDEVLGVQVERTANRTGAQVAPAATGAQAPTDAARASGVLPQTGAGDLATTMLAGLGLLAAGARLLSRRRASGTS